MAKGKKKEGKPLYRAVRFEIFPTSDQITLFLRVSKNLQQVWNEAWQERQSCYEQFFGSIYERIGQAKKRAQEAGFSEVWENEGKKGLNKKLRKQEISMQLVSEKESLLQELSIAFQEHGVTLYDQINGLTARRIIGEFALIPRNWQEETLDSLDGSFKSFLALRKNGDPDAKPPRQRVSENSFYKIPGRSGFKVSNGQIYLSFGKIGQTLTSVIPEFQLKRLETAIKLKKFELCRDERDMAKPGRFWISVAYEIPKPEKVPVVSKQITYLAIGASRLGVVSPKGEFCLNLPRSDYHWKPQINALQERLEGVVKGSRKWKKRMAACTRMFAKLGHQQKQHGQYEVVKKLLRHGVHFVVTELKVRSKPGALADASKSDRKGSPTGPNWSAQNTGNIARLIQKLTDKASEHGGTVIKRNPPLLSLEERQLPDAQRKIFIAKKLREEFLADQK